jgi:tetratricopeptide (TPR) repeat protein
MLLHLILTAFQELCAAPDPPLQTAVVVQGSHAQPCKLPWFQGSWDECRASAARDERLIFVELWMPWCPLCKKLGVVTLSDPSVVAELSSLVCYSIDTTDPGKAVVAKCFPTRSLPTLVFLEPGGEWRDVLSGYIPPRDFLQEVQRIKRNERTVTDLRSRLARDEQDIDTRYELALKLKQIGDLLGYKEEIAAIRLFDPKGRSVPSRLLAVEDLRLKAQQTLDAGELYALAAQEKEPRVLYELWYAIWNVEGNPAGTARGSAEEAARRERYFEAAKRLWPLVTESAYGTVANKIAWDCYEARASLGREDLLWALSIAKRVVEVLPDEPYVVDTLACCYFAVGRQEDALREIRRCIELEPLNLLWKERLKMFLTER